MPEAMMPTLENAKQEKEPTRSETFLAILDDYRRTKGFALQQPEGARAEGEAKAKEIRKEEMDPLILTTALEILADENLKATLLGAYERAGYDAEKPEVMDELARFVEDRLEVSTFGEYEKAAHEEIREAIQRLARGFNIVLNRARSKAA